jgi:hypothetical protein
MGRVQLVRPDGGRQRVALRFLVDHPRCRPSSRTAAEGVNRGRQPASWSDVKPEKRPLVEQRFEHLMEVKCGYRSGDPTRPAPGEPRPECDPDRTTLTARREAKAVELAALRPQEAKMLLGVARVGVRTLERWERRRRKYGMVGCADHRWLRESGGHPSVGEEVREAPTTAPSIATTISWMSRRRWAAGFCRLASCGPPTSKRWNVRSG